MREDYRADLLLVNARVWSRSDARIGPPQTIEIRGGRIVGLGVTAADSGLHPIDLEGRVVTAGFVNSHVHFLESAWAGAARKPGMVLQAELDDMLLSRGFTTVIDLSSNPRDTIALARRVDSGELRGPEILTAAGGLFPFRGIPFYVEVPWYLRWAIPTPGTPLGATLTVSSQARQGARVTKLFTGSWVTRNRVKPMRPSIARTAVAEAHRRGMRVFAHPSDRAGTQIAIEAGVDALAHLPSEADGTDELLKDAAARGIRVVPTLHMFASTVTSDESYIGPIREELRDFRAAGGRVMFGTDVGYPALTERDTRPELLAMEAAGMDAAAILRSLTEEPAQFFGWADRGTVAVGQRADLTVLATDQGKISPADFADVHAVIRGGRVVFGDLGL